MFPLAQVDEPGVRNTLDTIARTPLSQILLLVTVCTVLRIAIYPKLIGTAPHKRGGGYAVLRYVNEFLDAIVYAGVFVFMLIRPFAIQTFTIPSGSMLQTLKINDYIIANKAVYRYSDPQFGDIVVFKPPAYAKYEGQENLDIDYIKRCRGVPGDLIEIRNGIFYRNGVEVDEPFVYHEDGSNRMARDFKLVEYKGEIWPVSYDTASDVANESPGRTAYKFIPNSPEEMRLLRSLPPVRIPKDYYLMIGDNREGSYDGRAWGLIHRSAIIGKAIFVWWPPQRWQITR